MTPLKAFLIRAALSFVIAFMLYQLYFGKIVWVDVGVFAAILLALAYGSEAFRRRGKK